ncbi:MAG: signal peptidase I [Candidatus Paceibacterota bacterium]
MFSPPTTQSNKNQTPSPRQEHPLIEIVRFIIIALVIVIPIRVFIAQPFIVSGASMENTFHNNEYLIVDRVTYRFNEPERGDVVIFRYPRDPAKFFIKRLIGLPGDTVTINGSTITITNNEHPDGITLDEPYLYTPTDSYLTQTLDEGEYFVMGDNRNASSDSRVWGILTDDKIIGRALLRLFPLSDAAVMPGAYDLETGLSARSQ